jgi:two-component system response regulator AtoC
VLQQHHWNRKQAARTLGISYRALLYKIRDAGLPSNRALRLRQAEKNKPTDGKPADAERPTSGAAAD